MAKSEKNGLGNWIKNQAEEFIDDPLGYAIDRWIYLIFLGIGLSILIGAFKGLFGDLMSAIK